MAEPRFAVNDYVRVPGSGLGTGIITRITPEPDVTATYVYSYYVVFPHRDYSQFFSARHLERVSAVDRLAELS